MGEAARIALNEDLSQQMEKLQRFREVLINKLMEVIPAENMIVHGEGAPLLSTTACIGFKNFIVS
jgi:cysteine sulfinate desulfinase/cysteine desulfurase-like protein